MGSFGRNTLLIALVGIGFAAGAFFEGMLAPCIAHRLNGCASAKQFIVEFRLWDDPAWSAVPGLKNEVLNHTEATLDVDGESIGELSRSGPALRRFLCEGNHQARLTFRSSWQHDVIEDHRVEFAVSRHSLFHATDWRRAENEPSTCAPDAQCELNVGLELSPLEPDERSARISASNRPRN
jgi:hypothetical protein